MKYVTAVISLVEFGHGFIVKQSKQCAKVKAI